MSEENQNNKMESVVKKLHALMFSLLFQQAKFSEEMELFNIEHPDFKIEIDYQDGNKADVEKMNEYLKSKFNHISQQILDASRSTTKSKINDSPFHSFRTSSIMYSFSKDNRDIVEIEPKAFISDSSIAKSGCHTLMEVMEKYDNSNEHTYYHNFSIVQSTGYGKTKACFELSKHLRCVYLQCANKSDSKDIPNIVETMINELVIANNPTEIKIKAERLIYCVSKCAAKYETVESLHEAQFKSGLFYNELNDLWEAVIPSPSSHKVNFKIDGEEPITTIADLIINIFDDYPNLIIIFDEAVGLIKRNRNGDFEDTKNSPLRCLYREINESPKGLKGLFLSTSSNIQHLIPSYKGSGVTEDNRVDFPPITEIRFVDLFDVGDNFFLLGRPIWYAKYNYSIHINKDLTKLVHFALRLLTDKMKRLKISPRDSNSVCHEEYSSCALFCCRFNFRPIPQQTDMFVSHFLATLFHIEPFDKNEDPNYCISSYLPEPILVEASAYATAFEDEFLLEKSLNRLINQIYDHYQIIAPCAGDVGEYSAVMALTYAMDEIRKRAMDKVYVCGNNSFSSEVPVILLLKTMRPENYVFDLLIEEELKDFYVNFTHLLRVPHLNDETIELGYKRRTAFILKVNHKSIDILIVMHNKITNKYGSFFVQVKNYTSFIAMGQASIIIDQMKISDIEYCTIFNESPLVSLLLATGQALGKQNPIFEITTISKYNDSSRVLRNAKLKDLVPSKISLTACIQDFHILSQNIRDLLQKLSQAPVKLSTVDMFRDSYGGFSKTLKVQNGEYYDDNKDDDKLPIIENKKEVTKIVVNSNNRKRDFSQLNGNDFL